MTAPAASTTLHPVNDIRLPDLNRHVRRAIYDHVYGNESHEVGGVLVGQLGDSDVPTVTGSIAALEADEQRASVTFTHDAWSDIHASLDNDFPGEQIVGWYHSHPGFGIFLSKYDEFIHDNFFSDRRQIAYVVDPHAGTEGIFGWQHGKLVKLTERPAGRRGTRPTAARGNRIDRAPSARRVGEQRGRLISLGAAGTVAAIVVVILVLSGHGEPASHRVPGSQGRTRPGATSTKTTPAGSGTPTFTVPGYPAPQSTLVESPPALSSTGGSAGH